MQRNDRARTPHPTNQPRAHNSERSGAGACLRLRGFPSASALWPALSRATLLLCAPCTEPPVPFLHYHLRPLPPASLTGTCRAVEAALRAAPTSPAANTSCCAMPVTPSDTHCAATPLSGMSGGLMRETGRARSAGSVQSQTLFGAKVASLVSCSLLQFEFVDDYVHA